jgi:hypothetical protein
LKFDFRIKKERKWVCTVGEILVRRGIVNGGDKVRDYG